MRRIEKLLKDLVREGKITVAESIAIYGCLHFLNENPNEQFQIEYGTISVEALKKLLE